MLYIAVFLSTLRTAVKCITCYTTLTGGANIAIFSFELECVLIIETINMAKVTLQHYKIG